MRKPNKYLLILLATVTAYVLVEYYRPKPINWNPTYQNDDKIPFGTQALFELWPEVMNQSEVKTIRLPIYNFLGETKTVFPSNYVFICREFKADSIEQKRLFDYVKKGNTAFISAYNIPESFGEELGFKADLKETDQRDTTLLQNFANPRLKKSTGYNFLYDDGRNFLDIKKPKHITILGRNARNEPVFIRIQYGKGTFLSRIYRWP